MQAESLRHGWYSAMKEQFIAKPLQNRRNYFQHRLKFRDKRLELDHLIEYKLDKE